jgi:hypothetical protein
MTWQVPGAQGNFVHWPQELDDHEAEIDSWESVTVDYIPPPPPAPWWRAPLLWGLAMVGRINREAVWGMSAGVILIITLFALFCL